MVRIALSILILLTTLFCNAQRSFETNFSYSKLYVEQPRFIPSSVISPNAFFVFQGASSLATKNSDKIILSAFFTLSPAPNNASYKSIVRGITNPYNAYTPGDAIITGGINYLVHKAASKNWRISRFK